MQTMSKNVAVQTCALTEKAMRRCCRDVCFVDQLHRYFLRAEASIGEAKRMYGACHTPNYATFFVLNEDASPGTCKIDTAFDSVTAHAAEDDRRSHGGYRPGQGTKEKIDIGMGHRRLRGGPQHETEQAAREVDNEIVVRWGEKNTPRFQQGRGSRVFDGVA